MSGADPRKQWQEASRWFSLAGQDVRTAEHCLVASPPLLAPASFHCQQAAEKLMKGLLVASGTRPQRTHDLDFLADQVASRYPEIPAHLAPLKPLTAWQTGFRYPTIGDTGDTLPSISDIEKALKDLAGLRAAVDAMEPT